MTGRITGGSIGGEMTVVTTRIIVREDGSVSLATPLPAGEHVVSVEVPDAKETWRIITVDDLPKFDVGPWPDDPRLDREYLYGDDTE